MVKKLDKSQKLSLVEIGNSRHNSGEELLEVIDSVDGTPVLKYFGIKVPYHENDAIRLAESDFDDSGYSLTEYADLQEKIDANKVAEIITKLDSNGKTLKDELGISDTDTVADMVKKADKAGFELGGIVQYEQHAMAFSKRSRAAAIARRDKPTRVPKTRGLATRKRGRKKKTK